MPTTNTIDRQDMTQLAMDYRNPLQSLIYNQAAVPQGIDFEQGQFRMKDERAFFSRPETFMSKFTVPKVSSFGDSFLNIDLEPLGHGTPLHKLDLQQARNRGYASPAAYIQGEVEVVTARVKLEMESKFYTFVSTNGNFESASHYFNAGTAWSTYATADPLLDVHNAKMICKHINAIALNDIAIRHLQQNAKILAATNITGMKRTKGLDPTITEEHIMAYLGLDYMFVSKAEEITDSADESDTTTANVWGAKALLFHYNPGASANPNLPTWAKMFYLNIPGVSGEQGWCVKETESFREGFTGLRIFDVGCYIQFLAYAKKYAVRLDTLYA